MDQHAGDTLVARLMRRMAVGLLSALPIRSSWCGRFWCVTTPGRTEKTAGSDCVEAMRRHAMKRSKASLSATPEMDSSSTSAARKESFRRD